MTRMWMVVLAGVALGGCLPSPVEQPAMRMYRIGLDDAAWHDENRRSDTGGRGTLLVTIPQALAGFDTPRIAYRQRPFEVSYFATSQWADTPARMLAPLLALALDRSGNWKAVMPGTGPVRPHYRLDTYGLVLEQQFLERPSRVYLGAHMQLVELKDARVVGTRAFELFEEAETEDAYGGVAAANRAVTKLARQVVTWIEACVADRSGEGC